MGKFIFQDTVIDGHDKYSCNDCSHITSSPIGQFAQYKCTIFMCKLYWVHTGKGSPFLRRCKECMREEALCNVEKRDE